MLQIVLANNKANNINTIRIINSLNEQIKLYKNINNMNEILYLISNNSIDILIIDYNSFNSINGVNILNLISNLKLIIILTQENITRNNNNCIFCNESNIRTILNNFIENNYSDFDNNENIIKNKIEEELKYLGYNISYYGSKYLLECIYYIYSQKNPYYENTMKNIYSIIANKYHKSENTIKCNITRATSMMFCECEEEKLKKYLGLCSLPKSGSKIIIQTIINKLMIS